MPFLGCLQYTHPFPSLPFSVWINPEVAGEETSPAWVTWWEISPVKPDGRDLGISASRHPVGDVTSVGGSSSSDWQSGERERPVLWTSRRVATSYLKETAWQSRAENPSRKPEADLPKTDTASQCFGSTRTLKFFRRWHGPLPTGHQSMTSKPSSSDGTRPCPRSLWQVSWPGESNAPARDSPHRLQTWEGILWTLTGLLGLSPGPALRPQREVSLERLLGAAIASPGTRESCSLNVFVLLIPHGLLRWLGPQKTSPAFPSFSSLTRSSLPPAYFHILLYSRALLKPHSYPEFGLQCCYCSTGINSYPFHSLMLFSRFLRFSCLCSFSFLQRQEREEGQQRAKSARAASGDRWAAWFWALMCVTLGNQYRFLSGHQCCHL